MQDGNENHFDMGQSDSGACFFKAELELVCACASLAYVIVIVEKLEP